MCQVAHFLVTRPFSSFLFKQPLLHLRGLFLSFFLSQATHTQAVPPQSKVLSSQSSSSLKLGCSPLWHSHRGRRGRGLGTGGRRPQPQKTSKRVPGRRGRQVTLGTAGTAEGTAGGRVPMWGTGRWGRKCREGKKNSIFFEKNGLYKQILCIMIM